MSKPLAIDVIIADRNTLREEVAALKINFGTATRMHELIYDISFHFGHRWQILGTEKSSILIDMLEGSRGLFDRIKVWAGEFDEAWELKPSADYLEVIDDFADKKWVELLIELENFDPASGGPKFIGVQVIPVVDDLSGVVPQFMGPDRDTTNWAVYMRLAGGTAEWRADAIDEATAMLLGGALCLQFGVEVEPQPWKLNVQAI